MDEITLDEFIEQERLRLERFANMWREEHAASGHDFPDKLSPGDWDEQLQIFDA